VNNFKIQIADNIDIAGEFDLFTGCSQGIFGG